jgi:mannose-6-phosphate isomerase-like protein (cupin superfamily)
MKSDSIVKQPQSRLLKAGRVILNPGEEVGEHVTEQREEVIIIVKGIASLVRNGEKIRLVEGDAAFVQEGVKHNVINKSDRKLEYIYVVSSLVK